MQNMEEDSRYSLSVIIPNYNKGKYIAKCVESVLEQTLPPDEIIIVDDCSTDDSRFVIEKLCKNSGLIHPVYLDKNGGVSAARNVGLKRAAGQYITFLDSDDFYGNPDKLKNEMGLLRSRDKDGVAYSQLLFADESGNIKENIFCKKKQYLVGNIYKRMLLGRFVFPALARDYCVKKSIVSELGGYNEGRNLYEDLELLIKIAEAHSFYCTYQTGTAYRQTAGGLSSQKTEAHKEVRNAIFREGISKFAFWKRAVYSMQWKWYQMLREMQRLMWKCAGCAKRIVQRR